MTHGGDGVIHSGEPCDDGNTRNADGCSAACRIENGYECQGSPSVCQLLCVNRRMEPDEQCDDGNVTSGDGCGPTCQQESGYSCSGVPSVYVSLCGDGVLEDTEVCDDGNLVDGDLKAGVGGIDAQTRPEEISIWTGVS
ncbi:DUF4215 domain-containing protein [Archangium lansingense]|uniref:DUF4215 domain-containing protein n=1 Tax=Archangium lansingense TaxID=2995310 RepID=UPI003B7F6AB5